MALVEQVGGQALATGVGAVDRRGVEHQRRRGRPNAVQVDVMIHVPIYIPGVGNRLAPKSAKARPFDAWLFPG